MFSLSSLVFKRFNPSAKMPGKLQVISLTYYFNTFITSYGPELAFNKVGQYNSPAKSRTN